MLMIKLYISLHKSACAEAIIGISEHIDGKGQWQWQCIQYQHFDLWYCACDNKASVYIKLSNNCELNRAMKLTTGQVQLVPIKLIRGWVRSVSGQQRRGPADVMTHDGHWRTGARDEITWDNTVSQGDRSPKWRKEVYKILNISVSAFKLVPLP